MASSHCLRSLRATTAVLLALLFPSEALGWPWGVGKSPEAHTAVAQDQADATGQREEEANEAASKVEVNRNLVGKKVVVRCRDGRTYKGKLLEATEDYLRIETSKGVESVRLEEVSSVEKRGIAAWKLGAIVAAIGFGILWLVVFAKTREG